jgi:DNA-binding LytR/AlgR family response regulator
MERVLIIEDEQLAADKLAMLLEEIDPQLKVVGMLDTVSSAVAWLSSNNADLIFLDINLSDDISFKIFEQVTVEAPVIFVTAYDQFAIKAFKHNGIDYILKPVDRLELEQAVARYWKSKGLKSEITANIMQLVSQMVPQQQRRSRLLISYGDKSKSVAINEVAFFYSFEKGVYLTTFQNSTYLTNETLDSLEMELDAQVFFRLNRKILVSIHAIHEVLKYSTRQLRVILKPEAKFDTTVPAEKVTQFKQWLDQ